MPYHDDRYYDDNPDNFDENDQENNQEEADVEIGRGSEVDTFYHPTRQKLLDLKYLMGSPRATILTRQLFKGDAEEKLLLQLDMPWKVFCGCKVYGCTGVRYMFSLPDVTVEPEWREANRAVWENTPPPDLNEDQIERGVKWTADCNGLFLRRGEEVVIVKLMRNRYTGYMQNHIWRIACWEKMLPRFTEYTAQQRAKELDASKAKMEMAKLGRPAGRPKTRDLAPEQAVRYTNLTYSWATYKRRCSLLREAMIAAGSRGDATTMTKYNKSLLTASIHLKAIYDEAISITSVPSTWTQQLVDIVGKERLGLLNNLRIPTVAWDDSDEELVLTKQPGVGVEDVDDDGPTEPTEPIDPGPPPIICSN